MPNLPKLSAPVVVGGIAALVFITAREVAYEVGFGWVADNLGAGISALNDFLASRISYVFVLPLVIGASWFLWNKYGEKGFRFFIPSEEARLGLEWYQYVDAGWREYFVYALRGVSYSKEGLSEATPYVDMEISVTPQIPQRIELLAFEAEGTMNGHRLHHIYSSARRGGVYGRRTYTIQVRVDIPGEASDAILAAAAARPPDSVTWKLDADISFLFLGVERHATNEQVELVDHPTVQK